MMAHAPRYGRKAGTTKGGIAFPAQTRGMMAGRRSPRTVPRCRRRFLFCLRRLRRGAALRAARRIAATSPDTSTGKCRSASSRKPARRRMAADERMAPGQSDQLSNPSRSMNASPRSKRSGLSSRVAVRRDAYYMQVFPRLHGHHEEKGRIRSSRRHRKEPENSYSRLLK